MTRRVASEEKRGERSVHVGRRLYEQVRGRALVRSGPLHALGTHCEYQCLPCCLPPLSLWQDIGYVAFSSLHCYSSHLPVSFEGA